MRTVDGSLINAEDIKIGNIGIQVATSRGLTRSLIGMTKYPTRTICTSEGLKQEHSLRM